MSFRKTTTIALIAGASVLGYLGGRAHEQYTHRNDGVEITTTRPTTSPGLSSLFEISVRSGERTSQVYGQRLNEVLYDMVRNGVDQNGVAIRDNLRFTEGQQHPVTLRIEMPTQMGDVPQTFGYVSIPFGE